MNNTVKVWSVQQRDSLINLRINGHIRCDADKCDMVHFYYKKKLMHDRNSEEAYEWIHNKMKSIVGIPPDNVVYPIWGWYQYDGKTGDILKDIRQEYCGNRLKRNSRRQVVYELEIPKNRVCLTDFDEWHYVLNKWWLDDSTNEEEWKINQKWYDKLTYDEKELAITNSWNKIFDWKTKIDTAWIKRGFYTQATFWEIKPEYIVKVHNIDERN